MINTSNEYKEIIGQGGRSIYADVKMTLASGEILDIPQKKIRGLIIEDDVSGQTSFDIGAAIINQLTLKVDNTDSTYSGKEFDQAVITVKIGLQLSETVEWLNKGMFTADPGDESGDVITIKAYDNMRKFDHAYADSDLVYPATLSQIIRDACDMCGVSFVSPTTSEFDYVVQKRPADDTLTFREVLHKVGEIACCWFRCDSNGALEAGFYDLAAYEDETEDGFHRITNLTTFTKATEDIVITGIRVEQEDNGSSTTYQAGETGYVLSVRNNPLINADDAKSVATALGEKLIGMRFRKMSVSHQSDPSIEAGDLAKVIDRKGNVYKTLLTSTTFQLGGAQKSACNAQSPAFNSATRYSESTKAYITMRKLLRDEQTARETAVANLANALANSGGLYTTEEKQDDGSTIYYLHDKPTLAESATVMKLTAEAIGVSTDGGKTYPYGFTVTGEMVTRILQAEGVNAEWITAGVIKSKDGTSVVIDLDNGTADLTGNITTESVTEDGIRTYSQIRTDAIGTYKYNEDGELVARATMLKGLLWLSNETAGYVDFINASLRSSSEVDGLRIDEQLTVPNDLNTFEPTAYTSYAAPGQAEKLKVCGSPSSNYISGLTTPTGDSHAANKAYVDTADANLQTQINNIVPYGGTLSGAFNIDADYGMTVGWYWIYITSSTTGTPPVTAGNYGVLEVIRTTSKTSGVVLQRFTRYSNGDTYVRFYTNGKWYDWSCTSSKAGDWKVTSVGTATTSFGKSFTIDASAHDFLYIQAIVAGSTCNIFVPLALVATLGTYSEWYGYSATGVNVAVTSTKISFTGDTSADQTTSLKVYYMDR